MDLFLAAVVGAALARLGLIDKEARVAISRLNIYLLMPSLTFLKLARAVSVEELLRGSWFIPVNVLVSIGVSSVLGYACARLCCLEGPLFRFIWCAVSVPNVGNLPIALLGSVCRGAEELRLGTPEECLERGVGFTGMGMLPAQLVQWGVIYHLLRPAAPGFSPVAQPKEADEEEAEGEAEAGPVAPTRWARLAALAAQARPTPPVAAGLTALLVGLVPELKSAVFGLEPLVSLLELYAQAFIPCLMLVTGANMAAGPGAGKLPTRALVAACVCRLVLAPMIGLGIVEGAWSVFGLPDDRMLRMLCILQHSTPGALALGIICTVHRSCCEEASQLLFWQYLLAIPALSVSLSVALYFA